MKHGDRIIVSLILTLLWGGLALVSSGQEPTPPPSRATPEPQEATLSLESTLVDVVFTVTDAQNRPVTDLKREEVRIFEDGVEQKIEFFGRTQELPMLVALAVDFSGSQEFTWPKERAAAEQFFAQFFRWGRDYAALLTFRGVTRLHCGLTSDERRLRDALRTLVREDTGYASQGTALYDAAYIALDEVLDGALARRVLQRHEHRIRRALILITDGHDTSSRYSEADAIARAQRSGILIYAIGVSDSFRFADVNARTLDALTTLTGGRAYYPTDERTLFDAFRQIAEDLSSQFLLAYYPTNTARDGGFRRLQVQILGRPGAVARHRAGYFAPKAAESEGRRGL